MFMRWLFVCYFAMASVGATAATITLVPPDGEGKAAFFLIQGTFTLHDIAEFRTKASQFSKGVVVFDSGGGLVATGIEIGKIIRFRNFATWVPSGSTCASACAIAWLGGAPRAMGKAALVGFHAAYRVDSGRPEESGMANAVVGAYLGQLGLPDRAVMYVTSSGPESMTWLTPTDAKSFGIDVEIFDPTGAKTAASPAAPETPTLRSRAIEFVTSMYRAVNAPSDTWQRWAVEHYADEVLYFGKTLSRDDLMAKAIKFLERWPKRQYVPRPSTYEITCDGDSMLCNVRGKLDFRAESSDRNESSTGVATFEITVSFKSFDSALISREDGRTLERHKTPLVKDGAALLLPFGWNLKPFGTAGSALDR